MSPTIALIRETTGDPIPMRAGYGFVRTPWTIVRRKGEVI